MNIPYISCIEDHIKNQEWVDKIQKSGCMIAAFENPITTFG